MKKKIKLFPYAFREEKYLHIFFSSF